MTIRLRSTKVSIPPSSGKDDVDSWMREVTAAVNGLPVSFFSTSDGPNSSNVTAPPGFIGFEVGSSSTPLWIKTASGATFWSALSHIGY